MSLDEYLRQPCDEQECDKTATHRQAGRKVCNQHTRKDEPAYAMNG